MASNPSQPTEEQFLKIAQRLYNCGIRYVKAEFESSPLTAECQWLVDHAMRQFDSEITMDQIGASFFSSFQKRMTSEQADLEIARLGGAPGYGDDPLQLAEKSAELADPDLVEQTWRMLLSDGLFSHLRATHEEIRSWWWQQGGGGNADDGDYLIETFQLVTLKTTVFSIKSPLLDTTIGGSTSPTGFQKVVFSLRALCLLLNISALLATANPVCFTSKMMNDFSAWAQGRKQTIEDDIKEKTASWAAAQQA